MGDIIIFLILPNKWYNKKYMRFIDFKKAFYKFLVFDLRQIKLVDPIFNPSRLTEWQARGYIRKVNKGFYIFTDRELSEPYIYHIANRIYSPSYISMESALYYYALIPETVYGVSSISTKKTQTYQTELANFYYQSVSPRLFWGYRMESLGDYQFLIADPEKAVLDFLYLKSHLKTQEQLAGLRVDAEIFNEIIDPSRLQEYLAEFKNKSLEVRVSLLLKEINND